MRMLYRKKDIAGIVAACAEQYEAELNQKNLLFLCMDRHRQISSVEVAFHERNYLHMTGLEMRDADACGEKPFKLAHSFYDRCLAHRLSPEDFDVPEDGFAKLKLDVLPEVISKNLRANAIGKCSGKSLELYTEKLAGGQRACMGFGIDGNTGELVPNTLIGGDIHRFINLPKKVIAVFRKPQASSTYEEITYAAKKIDWESVVFPDPYEPLRHLILSAVRTQSEC